MSACLLVLWLYCARPESIGRVDVLLPLEVCTSGAAVALAREIQQTIGEVDGGSVSWSYRVVVDDSAGDECTPAPDPTPEYPQ
jgi:hypothetical protein